MIVTHRMGRRVIATNLRLERDLHRTLKAEARRARRSLNAEVLLRLRQSLEQPQPDAATA